MCVVECLVILFCCVLDFSDSIGRRKRIGYEDGRTEYEMVSFKKLCFKYMLFVFVNIEAIIQRFVLQQAAGVDETPLQKYQRLQHEIRELADVVASMKVKFAICESEVFSLN